MGGKHTIKRIPTLDKIMLILKYVAANPGGGIDEIIAGTGITLGAVVNTLKVMKDELQVKSERRGFGLRSTYYIRVTGSADSAEPTGEQRKKWDMVPGGRIVRAGEIIRRKYGCISPELRKAPRNAVKSAMD
jgi:hypothetical protein